MKILHFSTDDVRGGAAKAAYDLHRALRNADVDSKMLVRFKHTVDDDDVVEVPLSRWAVRIGRLQQRLWHKKWQAVEGRSFDPNGNPGIDVGWLKQTGGWNADVVAVHWVSGLLSVRTIRHIYDAWRLPIVMTLMDQSPVTGGCHYAWGCEGYRKSCGNCPQLVVSGPHDRSCQTLQEKKTLLSQLPLAFWCGSDRSSQMVKGSSLFSKRPVIRVSAPVNGEVFRPIDRGCARQVLGLPQNDKIIMCGANMLDDERKGGRLIVEAFSALRKCLQTIEPSLVRRIKVLIVGWHGGVMSTRVPFETVALGYARDERMLALAYQAADMFVCSSVEDEGPVMIPQAMMCGTPVVAFPTGSARELVRDGLSGVLCENVDSGCLSEGILKACMTEWNGSKKAELSKVVSAKYDARVVAREYLSGVEAFCESCRRQFRDE
jgi:glycosyltransferase involved in cell wall biosynthesis